ncbi:histidine--tRNA ligase, partial [Candidatus Bipolaricaulota bacterium]|nr:histidine--tRNA ligase [Candidatus Bipolaricaulota bacterium]
ILLLEELNRVEPDDDGLDLYLASLDDETKRRGAELIARLRRSGVKAEMDYLDKSLQGQLGYADRYGADLTAILGPEELSENEVTLRDMETGDQTRVPITSFVEEVSKQLELG